MHEHPRIKADIPTMVSRPIDGACITKVEAFPIARGDIVRFSIRSPHIGNRGKASLENIPPAFRNREVSSLEGEAENAAIGNVDMACTTLLKAHRFVNTYSSDIKNEMGDPNLVQYLPEGMIPGHVIITIEGFPENLRGTIGKCAGDHRTDKAAEKERIG